MLGEFSVGDAENVARREAHMFPGRGHAEQRALLGALIDEAGRDLIVGAADGTDPVIELQLPVRPAA